MIGKGLILSLAFVSLALFSQAQETNVLVTKDPLIDLLQEFRATNNINPAVTSTVSVAPVEKKIDRSTAKRVRTKGFRVQIFSGPSRSEAVNVQNTFLRQYSEMGAYLNYEEPNYRVKVGDFRTRAEANEFMRKMRGQYSNVFVFVEDIWIWQ